MVDVLQLTVRADAAAVVVVVPRWPKCTAVSEVKDGVPAIDHQRAVALTLPHWSRERIEECRRWTRALRQLIAHTQRDKASSGYLDAICSALSLAFLSLDYRANVPPPGGTHNRPQNGAN